MDLIEEYSKTALDSIVPRRAFASNVNEVSRFNPERE
jgi:hypothetical protein